MSAAHEAVNRLRCPVCGVPMLDGERAEWCYQAQCSNTQNRKPTPEQRRALKMDEKEARQ